MKTGIWDIWSRGDVISHSIATVLIAMSIASWAVIFFKIAQLVLMKRQGDVIQKRFWDTESFEQGVLLFGRAATGNPYVNLVRAAQDARDRHNDARLKESLSSDEWLQRCLAVALEEQAGRMAAGLGVLASVGSTAPFVGLFGTVWGIYHALLALGEAGQASLSQVAGPVGESLVMTALGLFVAIPAVLGYNAASRGNRGVMHKLYRFRHELHAYVMSGEQHRAKAPKGRHTHPHLVVEGGA